MNCRWVYTTCTVVLSLLPWLAKAQLQPEFNMSDTTITECQGTLYDSGGPDGIYGINEDLTTVIGNGVGTITVTFLNEFCVEAGLDVLEVYDGNSTAGVLLGSFSGTDLPPVLTAASGYVTFHLTSDLNVSYCGFTAEFDSDVPPPIPPDMTLTNMPACDDNVLHVSLSDAIDCALFDNALWSVFRNGSSVTVNGASPQCVDGLASEIDLQVSEPFGSNCAYTVQCEIQLPDVCGTLHPFTLQYFFLQQGCSVQTTVTAAGGTLCPAACTTVQASAQGCFTYAYSWNNGLPSGPGPHQVCPDTTTTYVVTITEIETGAVAVDSVTVNVYAERIITPSATICQSVADIFLEAESGGTWTGNGIEWETDNVFDPDSVPGGGDTWVIFESEHCTDTVFFNIIPIQTDDITAACPGSPAFQMNATPAGGTWNGPFATSTGTFDPSTLGSYTVLYTLNTCVDTLTVNVDNISGQLELDTLCQSIWSDTIQFAPLGGYWEGIGMIDSLQGIYYPSYMPPGDNIFVYRINGCVDSAHVYIKEINIGPRFVSACPLEAPLVWYDNTGPAPAGGFWSGQGLLNTTSGLFDPGAIPNNTIVDLIYYAPNGCTDTTFVWVIKTDIEPDTAYYCQFDDPVRLDEETLGVRPDWDGQWTGTGIIEPSPDEWYFDPSVAGVGVHTLYFLNNTCEDSVVMKVFPSQLPLSSFSFCSTAPAELLAPGLLMGGTWSGSAALDASTGLFDPGEAETGSYSVYWTNPGGCADSVSITVEQFQPAQIVGLLNNYCFVNENFPISLSPEGGTLTGLTNGTNFNPTFYGVGVHPVNYTVITENCVSSTNINVNVFPPITVDVTSNVNQICPGDGIALTANATGGVSLGSYTYTWSDGGFPVSTHNTTLASTGYISVTVEDGCSDAASDSVLIFVFDRPELAITTSDTLCVGETGTAEVLVLSFGNYATAWNGVEGSAVQAPAGSSQTLTVSDIDHGCNLDTVVFIPAFPAITAAFSINPNKPCIPFKEAGAVSFIDQSQNAVAGTWDFGNGLTQPYAVGQNPVQSYSDAGSYPVTLIVQNYAGCADTLVRNVCILPPTPIFIPDIFSPNGDGKNDVLFVRSQGVVSMKFEVFNRWGERVFRSTSVEEGWDGTYLSKPCMSGSYLYIMDAKLNDDTEVQFKGELTLIR